MLSRASRFSRHVYNSRRLSAELLGEFDDVIALRQSVRGHLSKGLGKFPHALLRHLPPPPLVPSVPIRRVSI